MKTLVAVLSALLLWQPANPPAPVGIEMHNVRLHVADDAILEITWLGGRLRSTSAHPPVFDDQHSFVMEIDDGEMAIDASSLSALVNRAISNKGAAL
jgi:hypothetical protein